MFNNNMSTKAKRLKKIFKKCTKIHDELIVLKYLRNAYDDMIKEKEDKLGRLLVDYYETLRGNFKD